MKKVILFASLLAACISCGKMEQVPATEAEDAHLEIDFTIGEETKGVKTDWATGDRVHIFFPGHYGYLVIKKTSSKWTAESWSTGLEAEIAATSSGKLSAVFTPITKFGGSLEKTVNWVFYDSSHHIYQGYVLEKQNASYTVSAGKLSASFTMSAPYTYNQFCLTDGSTFHHRNGVQINTNTYKELSRYRLTAGLGLTEWTGDYFSVTGNSSGEFNHNSNDALLTAYFQNGLCFSIKDKTADSNDGKGLVFTLQDSETGKSYVYKVPSVTPSTWNNKGYHAIKLPDLNAKENGVYRWVEQ